MSGPAHPIGLSIRGGTKVYPGTVALKAVDFDLRMGAVNVLVGENGAGKSTMMKVIAGVEQLSSGRVEMDGREVRFHSTDEAERHGIGIVFQELNLFPNLTVAENIFMAHEKTRLGVDIDAEAQRAETRALMRRLEHDIDPDTLVGDLKVGQQQIVEIAKSLSRDARILILDEPTSALSNAEVEILFRVIEELKAEGVGIVYISHRLEELIRVGDYITVLRDGVITGAQSMEGVDIAWIVRNMIGESSKDFAKEIEHPFGEEALRVENMRLADSGGGFAVDGVSLSLRQGEILGIYGLMGAGRTELLEAIIGRYHHVTGDVWVHGEKMGKPRVADRIAKGLALIPEDRKHDGLVQILSIRENMTLSSVEAFTQGFHMDLRGERSRVAEFVKAHGDQDRLAREPGLGAVGRQSAEGGDLEGADDRAAGAAHGRALARDRHRCQGRGLPGHAPARRRGPRHRLRDLGSRGGAEPLGPHHRHVERPDHRRIQQGGGH